MKTLKNYINEGQVEPVDAIKRATKLTGTKLYVLGIDQFDGHVFYEMSNKMSDLKYSEFEHLYKVLSEASDQIVFDKDIILFSHEAIINQSMETHPELSEDEDEYLQWLSEQVLTLGDWVDQRKWFLLVNVGNKRWESWLLTEKRNLSGEGQLGHRFSFIR